MRRILFLWSWLLLAACASQVEKQAEALSSEVRLSQQAAEFEAREKAIQDFSRLSEQEQITAQQKALRYFAGARSKFDKKQYEKALSYFLKSIKLDPTQDNVYYQYGVTLY